MGARVPALLWSGRAEESYAPGAEVCVVEDVPGESLEDLLVRDPARAVTAMADLARTLDLMWRERGARYGKLELLERGGIALGDSCEQVVLDRALRDLAEAAGREPRLGAAGNRLEARLRELRARVRPRAEYRLVHGELGPDHVLVDPAGRAVLIDIEDLMYFDAEWEHVFLRIRFQEHYPALLRPEHALDPARLDLYRLAEHLSLVAGPLRLLDGDFPDREFMRRIAEHHLGEALTLAG